MCDGSCYRIKTSSPHQYYKNVSEVPHSAVTTGLVEHTTSHGLPHIAKSRGCCKSVFWICLTIVMVFLWIGNTYFILKAYIKYDVTVNIDLQSSRTLAFPAVTVCNQNVLRKSAVESDSALNTSYTNSQSQTKYDPLGQNQQQGLGSSLDSRHQNAEVLYEILADYSSAQKEPWGHQVENFILTCDFTGYECSRTNFNKFYNWLYGNCFTFNPGSDFSTSYFTAYKTGPLGGLQLTLNIEQDEYLSDITYKAGARVVVHAQSDFPFPENQGLDISPGKATAVGIRKVEIQRKGGRYGACIDTTEANDALNVYEEIYTWTNYTKQACENTCYQSVVISNCSCYDVSYPSTGSAFSIETAPPCKSTDQTQANCLYDVQESYNNGSIACECTKACTESSYSVTVSTSDWPSNNYKESLKANLYNISSSANVIITADTMSSNFAFLEIYYENLNYELMKEDAAYEDSQFVADFGGAIGLWVGASMITVFEFGEYFLDLMILGCAKCCGKKSAGKVSHKADKNTTGRPGHDVTNPRLSHGYFDSKQHGINHH